MENNFFEKNRGQDITFINPYSYLILRKFRKDYLFNGDFTICVDGIVLVWVLFLLNNKNIKRLSFDDSSLAPLIFENCVRYSQKIGLIGSAPNIALKAKSFLKQRYPALEIVFIQDGYFKVDDEEHILANALLCDVIICSMGTPKQEDFLKKLRLLNWQGTGFTCGGYLDQLVSVDGGSYYPVIIDKFNLRWLYRIYKEPRRLLFRYLINYPMGIATFLFDYVFLKENIKLK